jgi:hypothetical protein
VRHKLGHEDRVDRQFGQAITEDGLAERLLDRTYAVSHPQIGAVNGAGIHEESEPRTDLLQQASRELLAGCPVRPE